MPTPGIVITAHAGRIARNTIRPFPRGRGFLPEFCARGSRSIDGTEPRRRCTSPAQCKRGQVDSDDDRAVDVVLPQVRFLKRERPLQELFGLVMIFLRRLDQTERVDTLKYGVGLGLLVGFADREGPSSQRLGFGVPLLMIKHASQFAITARHHPLGLREVRPDLLDRQREPLLGLGVVASLSTYFAASSVFRSHSRQRIKMDGLSKCRSVDRAQGKNSREESSRLDCAFSCPNPSKTGCSSRGLCFNCTGADGQGTRFSREERPFTLFEFTNPDSDPDRNRVSAESSLPRGLRSVCARPPPRKSPFLPHLLIASRFPVGRLNNRTSKNRRNTLRDNPFRLGA